MLLLGHWLEQRAMLMLQGSSGAGLQAEGKGSGGGGDKAGMEGERLKGRRCDVGLQR